MLLKDFFEENKIEYSLSCDLKDISTFRIGGKADIICYPSCVEQVSKIVRFCNENNYNFITLGRCSNVVFSDEGLRTLLIKTDKIDHLCKDGNLFTFGAGVMLAKASKYSIDNGYEGMEFSYGIPGSVGGAVYMNAGAYGGEMSHIVFKTEYVDDVGDVCCISGNEHDFSYRHSFFSDKGYIITSTTVCLKKGDKQKSEELVAQLQSARKSKQPLEYPSAGSVFKRPEGYFAGKLIQDCNLKGYSIGGAKVSEKHSGFIINAGNATCSDVKKLVEHIKSEVDNKFGVELECELKFITD